MRTNIPSSLPLPDLGLKRRPASSRSAVGIGLVILGLFVAIGSVMMPWWGMTGTTHYGGRSFATTVDYFNDQACVTMTDELSNSAHVCNGYLASMDSVRTLFTNTLLLSILGVISAAIAVGLTIPRNHWPPARAAQALAVLIASVMMLSAAVSIFFLLPRAMNGSSGGTVPGQAVTGFFGELKISSSGMSMTLAYGAGMGWIFGLLSFVLFLVGAILIATESGVHTTGEESPSEGVEATLWWMEPAPRQIAVASECPKPSSPEGHGDSDKDPPP